MGILNVTPDSFSDGGRFIDVDRAYQHAMRMIEQGADIIDIGGESSRPGAQPVSSEEEAGRVLPIIQRICANSDVSISIDTSKADVMQSAVLAGATMINDITALRGPNALETAAHLNVPICLMHMKGSPCTMQENIDYKHDVLTELDHFFKARIDACLKAGIAPDKLILDPGFGFGKSVTNNLTLVNKLSRFHIHKRPLMLGVSRKNTLGLILEKNIDQRMIGGITMAIFAAMQGVSIIRTHDVDETQQALRVLDKIMRV